MTILTPKKLRKKIITVLEDQGYRVNGDTLELPANCDKNGYRQMHRLAVTKKLAAAAPRIKEHEDRLLQYIANGDEVVPEAISPKLVLVKPNSEHSRLFRYASLHWSIPVSEGYGRRLRFLVFDENNGKLIGLFALGDPVYALKARDNLVGWAAETKKEKLYHVMDAYVLGAVPPYSYLLGGKLVAMLTLSNEVRRAFRERYSGRPSIIKQRIRPPYLTMLTTTSALGRSSLYNRIRIDGFSYWKSVGFTQGWGEFHFSNGVYEDIRAFVKKNCKPTAKQKEWGTGFRNKREVVRKCLLEIGLSLSFNNHGILREIFVAPLGRNSLRFLRGEVSKPCFYDWPSRRLGELFKERWLLSRAERMPNYREFDRESYRLWHS